MHVLGERSRNSHGFNFRDGRDEPEGKDKRPEPTRISTGKTVLMCVLCGVAFAATLLVKLAETAT